MRVFRFLVLVLWLGLVSGCSGANPLVRPTATVVPTATPTAARLTSPESAAREVIQAMALVNYRDPQLWKTRMLELSTNEGKQFWQANFDRMLADVLAHKRIAQSVKIDQVTILGQQTQTDTQGRTRAASVVIVTGRITYSDDAGSHDEPINQPMLLANLDGQWKFVELLPLNLMTPAAPSPTPKK